MSPRCLMASSASSTQQQVSSYGSAGGTIELNVVNNEARGTITGLMDKPVSLYFSRRMFHIAEMRKRSAL